MYSCFLYARHMLNCSVRGSSDRTIVSPETSHGPFALALFHIYSVYATAAPTAGRRIICRDNDAKAYRGLSGGRMGHGRCRVTVPALRDPRPFGCLNVFLSFSRRRCHLYHVQWPRSTCRGLPPFTFHHPHHTHTHPQHLKRRPCGVIPIPKDAQKHVEGAQVYFTCCAGLPHDDKYFIFYILAGTSPRLDEAKRTHYNGWV